MPTVYGATYPGGNTDEETNRGSHMNINDCSSRSDNWSNSANNAATAKAKVAFTLAMSRALHFVQDMACIVHLKGLYDENIYLKSTYTNNQAHKIYEMQDGNGNSMVSSLYGLKCNGSNDCSYNAIQSKIPTLRKDEYLKTIATAKFWLNETMRKKIISIKEDNIGTVLENYKKGSYNTVKNILIDDLAYAAVLMEKWLKYGPLKSHFTVP